MKKLGEYSVNYVVSSLLVPSSHYALFRDRGLGKVHLASIQYVQDSDYSPFQTCMALMWRSWNRELEDEEQQ